MAKYLQLYLTNFAAITMKISIITAAWNSQDTIKDTLASVDQQTYPNTEYIIIDGASSDNTVEIVRATGRRVDHLVSEKDMGIYDALNKGISIASGDVIGFLHSDDVYANKFVLSNIAEMFLKSGADAVFGDLDYVSKFDISKIVRRWRSGNYSRDKLMNGWMPPHPTFYMKREFYEKYGAFNLSYKIAADYDSLLRYLWKNKVTAAYLPEVLVKMRVGGASNRSLSNILRKSCEDARTLRVNGLPVFRALLGKNLSKIPQFFRR